ncbi:MAG: hypothetical protein HY659_15170 [Rhizobiales bacterium]|nr:hypothetical protein [Hyphomicrobiales bacterium]
MIWPPIPSWSAKHAAPGIVTVCGLFLLAGCAYGDFGRLRPLLVEDDIHAWVGADAARAYGQPISPYELTDPERKLRDLAFPLIQPPYDRQRWYSVLSEYGILRNFNATGFDFNRTAYCDQLMSSAYRSTSTRYRKLTEDIRNDITRIGPFFATARKVLDLDRKREKSMAYVAGLSPADRTAALSRVNENKLIVNWVHRSLAERTASYRIALERLVIETPSDAAVNADRSLTLLRQRIAEHRPEPVALLW